MNHKQRVIKNYERINRLLLHANNLIPLPLDKSESDDWDFIKWCNKCAIESLEMAITHIEHMEDEK
jgi:hypothetical protein